MLKNKTFHEALMWLVITGMTTYLGLYKAVDYDVFLYGVWTGVNFANAVLRFKKAYKEEKGAK